MATRRINSVEKGGALLKVLAEAGRPMMLRDVAQALGVAPGIAHSYLASYREFGLVEQDEKSGFYKLGPFALTLGLSYLRGFDPFDVIYSAMPSLYETFGDKTLLAMSVWSENGPVIVRSFEPLRHVHANVRPGAVLPITRTGTGQLFAAFLPFKLVELLILEELARSGEPRKARDEQLAAMKLSMPAIRKQGYSRSPRRINVNTDSVSAPIFDHTGHMQAAITMIGPAEVVESEPDGRHVRALTDFTQTLSRRLGWTGGAPDPSWAAAPSRTG